MMSSALYIHIPFCHSKCSYCDFYSVPRSRITDDFVDALCQEARCRIADWPYKIDTIYIGGGTPTSLSDAQLRRLIGCLPCGSLKEFTIEVNPEDITPQRAASLKEMPFDRVSMGIQSLDDGLLSAIGRRHTASQAVEAYEMLSNAGFDNISCDLIFGLPGQSMEQWLNSLKQLIALHPKHISAYMLSYEPGTRLHAMLTAGKIAECDGDTSERMYLALIEEARQAGYRHYEISNFALPGYEAVHNSRYWDFTPYLGLGPGAHGFDGSVRFYNSPDLKAYISGVGMASRIEESETSDERFNDLVMTSLRTARGLSLDEVSRRCGLKYRRLVERTAMPYLASGLMVSDGDRLYIPELKWLVSNDIIADFMAV